MAHFPTSKTAIIAYMALLSVNGSYALASGSTEDSVDTAWIASSAVGAMVPPEQWDCDHYVSEYKQFIEEGNAPEDWRFVGKQYRAVDTGEFYDWPMWLEWEKDADCAGMAAMPGTGGAGGGSASMNAATGGGLSGTTVGLVAGVLGLGGAAAAAGGGGGDEGTSPPPKSPG